MARIETLVQLTEELRRRLDEEAARRGISRSVLIREAAEAYLAAASQRDIDAAIVAGYNRIPQAAEDERTADAAARELLARLDAEEREAGLPPW
ncbi:MAG TPA: ribbon-helix-helix protein, CopG family [Actinomycetota bacterium]